MTGADDLARIFRMRNGTRSAAAKPEIFPRIHTTGKPAPRRRVVLPAMLFRFSPLLAAAVSCLFPAAAFARDAEPVEGDPLFFVRTEAESGANEKPLPKAALLRLPTAPPVLKSATLEVTYEIGKDYLWEPGKREILLPEGSRIPFKEVKDLYPAEGQPNSYRQRRDSASWMLFGEGRFFHDLQSVASYSTTDDWTIPVPAPAPDAQLGALRKRLREGGNFRLVTLGDSISTGANASGAVNAPPAQPGYPDLVARGLEAKWGVKVTAVNLSVGGMAAPWGVDRIPQALAETPDLLLVAFGMNDASGRAEPGVFANNIRTITDRVRRARPTCQTIVISPMTANSEWSYSAPDLYPAYTEQLATLTEEGRALADVFHTWTSVLERKDYLSLSGNGLNHPNDFGHRLYAETILAVIGAP